MCGYPAPLQGLLLFFAILGALCMVCTVALLAHVRRMGHARGGEVRLVRYNPEEHHTLVLTPSETPGEPDTLFYGRKPFRPRR